MQSSLEPNPLTRRRFLQTTAALAATAALSRPAVAQDTYETQIAGIRILPGHWRPHYPWEHIAWVSPSWPSQDYIWLDFPEAIFTNQGLIYLSHINPPIDTVYDELPAVPWQTLDDGITFDRTLPSGIAFGGTVRKVGETTVGLELRLTNGSPEPLTDITLQTCAFLRAIREFAAYSRDNKFVHIPEKGWMTMSAARELPGADAPYGVGWRSRHHRVADYPIAVVTSSETDRLAAMTWQNATLSMIENPGHPCFHADPWFPDLEPGQTHTIHGKLIFFEGALEDFDPTTYR